MLVLAALVGTVAYNVVLLQCTPLFPMDNIGELPAEVLNGAGLMWATVATTVAGEIVRLEPSPHALISMS